jgi:hypothetical protein
MAGHGGVVPAHRHRKKQEDGECRREDERDERPAARRRPGRSQAGPPPDRACTHRHRASVPQNRGGADDVHATAVIRRTAPTPTAVGQPGELSTPVATQRVRATVEPPMPPVVPPPAVYRLARRRPRQRARQLQRRRTIDPDPADATRVRLETTGGNPVGIRVPGRSC